MKKRILIWIAAVGGLILLSAGGLWYASTQPIYTPGVVRAGSGLRAPLAPPAQAGDPNFWQVEDDIQLYHFARGQGRNVLVIHGGPGLPFRQAWSGLEPLAGEFTFHYYDQRGCGKSTRPFDSFSSSNTYQNMTTLEQTLGLGAQIADIERIRRILGDEQILLVGHSWGGFLASLYAAEFPEHVAGLVLVSPATTLVMPQAEADLFDSLRARLPAAQQAEYDAFLKDYMDFNRLFERSEAEHVALNNRFGEFYISVMPPAQVEQVEQGEPGGWMVWAMYLSMGQRHDYRAALQAAPVPVLVLHGANDLQSEAASRQYADLFPQSSFYSFAQATHFAFEEQPDLFAGQVKAFLNGLE